MKAILSVLSLLAGLLVAQLASAETVQNGDRLKTIAYQDGAIISVDSAIGHGIMILFSPGERVITFDAVDPDAFNIDESVNTGSLIIRTVRTPMDSNISVQTQIRNYSFSVQAGMPEDADMVVQLTYDLEKTTLNSAPTLKASQPQYRITGETALSPIRISDNGTRTFLVWGEDQALPAVFAINPFGDEEIVDGYMRNGIYTIDRVYPKLVFRIDRKAARAERNLKEWEKQ